MSSIQPPAPFIETSMRVGALSTLCEVPVPPHDNPLDHHPIDEKDYTLPFNEERLLTESLAYISGFTKEGKNTTAVGTKENRLTSVLTALIAVNKGNWSDGDDVLDKVKRWLERLFKVLRRASDASFEAGDVESEILRLIVYECHGRILWQLKLDEKSIDKNPTIKDKLKKARESCSSPILEEQIKEVESLIDEWISNQTEPMLMEVINGLYHLWQKANFDAIPDDFMGSKSKEQLLNTISMAARYKECAISLCHLEKKYSIFGQMQVELVCPRADAFQRTPDKDLKDLAPILPSLIAKWNKKNQSTIYNCLTKKKKKKNHVAEKKNHVAETESKRTKETLKKAKIHAEIQLLLHCDELDESDLPPRVVCASKDSCFLCNEFISMHGKMYTPRSHGRIYHMWRLPYTVNIDLRKKFDNRLDGLITNRITALGQKKKPARLGYPNESTVPDPIRFHGRTFHKRLLSYTVDMSLHEKLVHRLTGLLISIIRVLRRITRIILADLHEST